MKFTNPNDYNWTEGDISKYAKEFLRTKLTELNYHIVSLECESYIIQRMGDVNLLYFIDFSLEKETRGIALNDVDQFTDFTELKEPDRSSIKNIFEQFRADAILKYSSMVLSSEINTNNSQENKPAKIKVYPVKEAAEDRGDINISYTFNRNKKDLLQFMFDRKFIFAWTNGTLQRYNKTGHLINNEVALFNIRTLEYTVICDFGVPGLNKFNRTVLEFVGEGDCCTLNINIQSANRELKEMYENLLRRVIINPMCFTFGFIVIEEEDDDY